MNNSTREKVIELLATEKSMATYEKITDFNSLESKAEDDVFLEKSEFFSELKQVPVGDEESEN